MPFFGVPIRNGLPIGLGSVAGFGAPQEFSPADLFSAGEQGAWYDPSDYSTLFQNAAGTTPVTAVEQPVRLMLDKSKGLVLGPELVTNGDFSSGTTGWTAHGSGASISASNNILTVTQTGGDYGRAYQALSGLTVGATYQYTANIVSNPSSRPIQIWAHSSFTGTPGSATYSQQTTSTAALIIRFVATAATMYVVAWFNTTLAGSFGVSNASVKLLPGNHATAPSDTARPTLRARYNLLTRTEEFNDAAWVKTNATVTPNQGTAPDGTNTVAKIVFSGGVAGYQRVIEQNPGTRAAGTSIRFSIWARGENGGESLEIVDRWGGGGSVVLTTTLTRYSFTFFANGTSNNFYVQSPNNNTTVYVWGAQVTLTAVFPSNTYQRVGAATDYDTAGFLPYLDADGTDDSMATGNIAPGADKAQVFAAICKLSDSAQGVVAELSANIASNNGALLLAAPDGATQTYGFDSKGTTQVDAVASSLAAPRTNVVTGLADIAGDSCIIRVNGAVADTETGDQGSGNFLTYPLYLFGRGGSSVYFRGWMYGMIVRFGSNLGASQIDATENYLNQKSGAF